MKGEITTDILLKEMITIDLIKAVVVVTGSSSGIGRAVAVKYLQEGYVVCGLDNNVSNNKNHIDEYLCDVSNEEEVKIVFTKIQQKYGSVKYLINCAGIFFATSRTSIETMILSEWDRVIKNNLNSYIIVTKYAIPLLKNADGDRAIINISSDQALFPRNKNSAYAASKAGIQNFSHACAVELIEYKIRVNCVLPASVRSNFVKKIVNKDNTMESIFLKEDDRMPLGIIEPCEVAEMVFFLGSEKAKKVTGQSILMDSGLYI